MSRYAVPEAHIPGWIYSTQCIEIAHKGRRFLAGASAAFAVEGNPPAGARDHLKWSIPMVESYPPAALGAPFLRSDAGSAIRRSGLSSSDLAIPVGSVLCDLGLVAITHYLYPGCSWRAPSLPGYVGAFVDGQIVALVATLQPTTAHEETLYREAVIHHGA